MKTWLTIAEDSDFSIYNIPFGIFSVNGGNPRVGIAIGDQVMDLGAAYDLNVFAGIALDRDTLSSAFLNDFIAQGKSITIAVRERIQSILCDENTVLRDHPNVFYQQGRVEMHMPVDVRDYTDFYSSIEHATNVGKLFRDPENALLPNWKHLPVGYHGRASSIIVSGEAIHRPVGQTKPPEGDPIYGPCRLLDFELEMAFIIGKASRLGDRITTDTAADYIFGMALFNDWSARDIQKWEYVPLGPFLGKSFASSLAPWVVTMEALDYFREAGPQQDPPVLPYLQYSGDQNYDVNLAVTIAPPKGEETTISRSNYKYMYWNQLQQLAHHTVNGCNVNVGDLMASGTISGKDEFSYGSLLEITQAGKKTLTLKGGEERKFVMDHDTVTMRGYCERDGRRVGFGEVSAQILPAKI